MDNNKYWMVHNPSNRHPVVMHEHIGLAIEEAKRLAALHLGQTFVVLEAMTAYATKLPEPPPVVEVELKAVL